MDNFKKKSTLRMLIPVFVILAMLVLARSLHFYISSNVVGIGIGLGGLLFSYIGIGFWISEDKKTLEYTGECIGHVTGYSESYDSEGRHSYSINVNYAVGGEEYSMGSAYSYGSKRSLPPVGSPVTIYYHPSNPRLMQTEYDKRSNRRFVRWFLAFGLPMVALGTAMCTRFELLPFCLIP